jgi:hypothetical protein
LPVGEVNKRDDPDVAARLLGRLNKGLNITAVIGFHLTSFRSLGYGRRGVQMALCVDLGRSRR